MGNLSRNRTAIQLNVARNDNNPSIFLWTILPEHIIELSPSSSGGTDVITALPNGEKVTTTVTQKIEQIKKVIEICKKTDGL